MLSRRTVARYAAGVVMNGSQDDKAAILQQLAAYLVASKKQSEADMLVLDIMREIQDQFGVAQCRIVSARPLTDELTEAITRMVQANTGVKSVVSHAEVDTDLIGGFIASTPTFTIDASIQGKLRLLMSTGQTKGALL